MKMRMKTSENTSVLFYLVTWEADKGRKRGRNSKSNYQEYKGWGHLRPQRKKETQKDRAMCWTTRHGKKYRRLQSGAAVDSHSHLQHSCKTCWLLKAASFVRLKVWHLRPGLVRSQGLWSLWGQWPAAPAPPARSVICENSMSCCCQIFPFLEPSQKCGHWSLYKAAPWAKQNLFLGTPVPVLTVWIMDKTRLFLHTPWLGAQFSQLGQKCLPGTAVLP